MENYEGNVLVNVGTGRPCTIAELAAVIQRQVGFKGEVMHDQSLPDGVLEKMQDLSRIREMGWSFRIELEEGIRRTYQDFVARTLAGELPEICAGS